MRFFALSVSSAFPLGSPITAPEQQVWGVRRDKRNIRPNRKMLSGISSYFFEIPGGGDDWKDFDLAKIPPAIEFAIIQDLAPEYLMRRPAAYRLHIPSSERVE